jgi:RimJ/RimL family protein N-acetyltransferase
MLLFCSNSDVVDMHLVFLRNVSNKEDLRNFYAAAYDSKTLRKYHNLGNDYDGFDSRRGNKGEYWAYVDQIIASDKKLEDVFLITNKDGVFVGICKIFNKFNDPKCMYISYTILLSQQGNHYASFAVKKMLDYIKWKKNDKDDPKYANVEVVKADINDYHTASIKVVERNGFKKEASIHTLLIPMSVYIFKI